MSLKIYDAARFGCVGDGSTDNTSALQSVINRASSDGGGTIYIPPGTYRITDNIFWHGNVSIVGPQTAILQLDDDPTYSAYWICGGISGYGATAGNGKQNTVTGELAGLKITATANVTAAMRLVNCFRYSDLRITNVTFDVSDSAGRVGPIGFYNNNAYCADNVKNRLTITGNHIVGNQSAATGSEGIGIGDAQDSVISANTVYGMGDDAIAFHYCENTAVIGNNCRTKDGRILCDTSWKWQIVGNYVARTGADSGGAYIHVDIAANTDEKAPCDGTISANVVEHSSTLTSATYGIRVSAGRRIAITGNVVTDLSSGYGYGVYIEGKTGLKAQNGTDDWVDPEGLDADATPMARSISAVGNLITGSNASARVVVVPATSENATISVHANKDGLSNALTLNSSGAITPTGEYHVISSETGTTDDLVYVYGNLFSGQIVRLRAAAGHTITVKNGTGDIICGKTSGDVTLVGDNADVITLVLDADLLKWLEV